MGKESTAENLDQYQTATWDIRTSHGDALIFDQERRGALIAWAERHGIDPKETYRLDVLALDSGAVRVWQYDKPRRLSDDGETAVVRPPYVVKLREPAPAGTMQ